MTRLFHRQRGGIVHPFGPGSDRAATALADDLIIGGRIATSQSHSSSARLPSDAVELTVGY
jgi:hypothetical protein